MLLVTLGLPQRGYLEQRNSRGRLGRCCREAVSYHEPCAEHDHQPKQTMLQTSGLSQLLG